MGRNYDLFHHYLENDEKKLKLTDLELQTLSDYFSYVEKCDLIKTVKLSKLTTSKLTDIYQHYSALYLKSQKVIGYKIL